MPLLYYLINLLAIIINKNDPTKDRIIGASIPREGIENIPIEYNNPPKSPPIIPNTKYIGIDIVDSIYLLEIIEVMTPHIIDNKIL